MEHSSNIEDAVGDIVRQNSSAPPAAKNKGDNKKTKSITVQGAPDHKFGPKGHTELIIGVSRARQRQESFAQVQKSVTPQNLTKITKTIAFLKSIFLFFLLLFFLCAKRRTALKL